MINKRQPKKMTSLWSIIQGQNETFDNYAKSFIASYSCMAKPDEEFVIQAYIIGLNNESMKLALGSNNISDIESLIVKAHKLSETLEMSRSRMPRPQYYDQKRMELEKKVDSDRGSRSFLRIKSTYKSDLPKQHVHKKFKFILP